MGKSFSRLGLVLSLSYLALFALSGVYAIYLLVFHTANSEFCGLPAIMVTMPWSLAMVPLMNALGVVAWYEKFSGSPAVYGFWAMLALVPSALPNAAILYWIGRSVENHYVRHHGVK